MDEKPAEAVTVPPGVTVVYVYDGRVIAHASDFKPDRPGGYTTQEAQEYRARRRLAMEVVQALASRTLWQNLDSYECERIMEKMGGKSFVIHHSAGDIKP